jgi:hypothetical protein
MKIISIDLNKNIMFSNTRANIAIKIETNKLDIIVLDKNGKLITTIVEMGITSQNQLLTVETEKKSKYDILS